MDFIVTSDSTQTLGTWRRHLGPGLPAEFWQIGSGTTPGRSPGSTSFSCRWLFSAWTTAMTPPPPDRWAAHCERQRRERRRDSADHVVWATAAPPEGSTVRLLEY
jgi:hypothetical protein